MKSIKITPNLPEIMAESDSCSIQNAVDYAKRTGANQVVIPRFNARTGENVWIIDTTIKLPSDMYVVLDNCFIQMADDVVGGFFCSENFTENGEKLNERLHNIHIEGRGNAVLDGGKPTALNEITGKELGVSVKLNTPILFVNVEGFKVTGITISNHRYWGMRFEFCARGVIRDIFVDAYCDRRNQDGINLRNGCHDILIENVSGQTGDDMIALSAIDTFPIGEVYEKYPFFKKYPLIVENHDWDIHDVTIRNISGAAIHHPLVALRNHNGAKIYNITIENIKDTPQIHYAHREEECNYERYAIITIGCNSYYTTPAAMGDLYNITVRDVCCNYSYRVFYVQAVLKNCMFSDIKAGGNCRHIISVMPEGWASARSGVKLENVTIKDVAFSGNPEAPKSILLSDILTDYSDDNITLADFPLMRDGDYVKNLYFDNLMLEKVDCLAEVAEKALDRVEIKCGRVVSDRENILDIRAVNRSNAKVRCVGDADFPKDKHY